MQPIPRRTTCDDDPIAFLIQSGQHRAAIQACVPRYGQKLGRLAFALLGNQAEADEVVQEVFLDAYRGMAGYRAEGSVSAWLFTFARRKCARRLERRGRHERHLRLVASGSTDVERPDDCVAVRQRVAEVRRGLLQLKPSEREAILLRYQAELSYREIGWVCGIEADTARKRVSRGLVHLRRLIAVEAFQ